MKSTQSVYNTNHINLMISELKNEEMYLAITLLSKFYPNLDENLLKSRLDDVSRLNWKCLGLFSNDKLIGLSGYWINTRIYCGKYLYIDHFIIDDSYRCKGSGAKLLNYLKELAIANNCEQVCLDTFVSNSLAQSFWSRHGFKIVGFHYVGQ
ncbi:GNAT family N-acetyltransferase [Acinetobacter puyangensis]|uniref:GNAT family N-acetyltransferase n=1 Tax=Acinetobacter puyangensis TaxID=1096779 RepID=UPI003A4E02F2